MTSILKVDTIQDQSGNNIINESADTITIGASGDTVTIPSGATIDLSSATQTGVGGTNTPAFFATQTTAQSIANSTGVTLNFGTEAYDTDSALTTTTFTVPTGKGGIYYFYAGFRLDTTVDADRLNIAIKVGATSISSGNFRQEDENSAFTSGSANLSAGDAVTVEAFQTTAGSRNTKNLDATFFGGFRLIQ
jgi:hypothetical protein